MTTARSQTGRMTDDRNKPMQASQWYVSVEERTVGPVPTDLIIRGLAEGKVPPDAMVCPVGATEWDWVASVEGSTTKSQTAMTL